jgi:hypothetical protein
MGATMAIKLTERNAWVCFKVTTRTMTRWWKASESKSEKQYGNQLFHFFPLGVE